MPSPAYLALDNATPGDDAPAGAGDMLKDQVLAQTEEERKKRLAARNAALSPAGATLGGIMGSAASLLGMRL